MNGRPASAKSRASNAPNARTGGSLPVTDDVIRWHLSGRDATGKPFVAGAYPMLLDETCFFVAVDFDKGDWFEDASAFVATCRRPDLSAALERSRSGRGGHVGLFFEQAVPTALGRKLATHVLTETAPSWIRGYSRLKLSRRANCYSSS
jgi:hypothetical protein